MMADFDPPFAQGGDRRLPSNTEQNLGIACDTADLRELLNGLFWLLQAQVNNVADEAGEISSGPADVTLLYRSIAALIAAASGGSPADYILMSQARARLPIFPHVMNDDGHLGVIAVTPGTIRVPVSKSFLHRGIFNVTTAQTDLNTDASKTYHLRWNPTDGFTLRDLASGAYNPTSAAETNEAFDSVYDDMLVARIVCDSGNNAQITNLINRDRILIQTSATGAGTKTTGNTVAQYQNTFTLNLARTPKLHMGGNTFLSAGQVQIEGWTNRVSIDEQTRYRVTARVMTDYFNPLPGSTVVQGELRLLAIG